MQFVENTNTLLIKIYKFICLILKSNYRFFSPNKKKILIFDEISIHILKEILYDNDYYVLNVRKSTLHLNIFFKSLINYGFKWNFNKYLIDVINFVSPDSILSFSDNNTFLWKLKKKLKKKTSILLIQNGYRNYAHDVFEIIDENNFDKAEFEIDLFAVFSEATKNYYSNYIKGEKLVIGSFRNNQIPIKLSDKNLDIIFISEFASKKHFTPKYNPNDYWYPEYFFLPIIQEFAINNKLKFKILGKLNNDQKLKDEEVEFYNKIIGQTNWEYVESNEPYESYKKIDKCRFVIFVSSTLGYEAIARGKPTAALCSRNFKYNKHKVKNDYNFAWPANIPDKGIFWTNDCKKDETINILNFVNNVSHLDWKILKDKMHKKFMFYNDNNELFMDKLKNLNIKIKNQ